MSNQLINITMPEKTEQFSPEDIAEAENPGGAERTKALNELRDIHPGLNLALDQITDPQLSDEQFMDVIHRFNDADSRKNYTGMYHEYPVDNLPSGRTLCVRHYENGTVELQGSLNY